MNIQTVVSPFSQEWIYASFRLQLLLGSNQVQLLSLRKHTPAFPQNFENHMKVEAAVDLTDMDLPSVSSIKDSLRKDLVLRSGRITINQANLNAKRYRILLLKVSFSQALPCVKDTSLSVQDFLTNQSQFDAVYMSPRHQEISVFVHDYMVRDPRQYQWEYDAEFTFTQRKQWDLEKVVCANCKVTSAKSYCPEDKQAYCWPCFSDLHRSERKSRHPKQPLSPYNCPPRCQKGFHHNEPLSHYCFSCKQLKCSYCLTDSDHKNGQQSGHITMDCRVFANDFKLNLSQKINQVKNKIASVIKEIEAKIQLISGHYDLRVKQYAKAFEERVASIREQTTTELNRAVGLHSQLKRKYDQSLWLETFSGQLQQKCDVEMNIQMKEGINLYLNDCFTKEYFFKMDKKVQQLKIFK